ncbi:MAG: DUF1223 domain-containing protein [Caulobacteraceae bacterium]
MAAGGVSGARAASSARPVLVELFTAQGCSACPEANRFADELADRKGVEVVTFPVDYWDYLGWSDTFAQPEFTARQRAYQTRWKLKEIYTPEIVVGGSKESPGSDREKVEGLLKSEKAARGPQISFQRKGARVSVGEGAAALGTFDVWLVRYDPRKREVKVERGENRGKTVVHRNVARELVRLGGWSGRARTYPLPVAKGDGLKSLIVVQGVRGGRVLAIGKG